MTVRPEGQDDFDAELQAVKDQSRVSLGPFWEAYLAQQVEGGRYSDRQEVLRAGLRELQLRESFTFFSACGGDTVK